MFLVRLEEKEKARTNVLQVFFTVGFLERFSNSSVMAPSQVDLKLKNI